jgi:hypothetical protein
MSNTMLEVLFAVLLILSFLTSRPYQAGQCWPYKQCASCAVLRHPHASCLRIPPTSQRSLGLRRIAACNWNRCTNTF